jgi:protein-S-isoprenylcysteine O-methyltransferase Ste14
MPQPEQPLFRHLRDELASLAGEGREMLGLRWELARLEMREDAQAASRLARIALIAAIMALTALPLLTTAAAFGLGHWTRLSVAAWLVILGVLLLAIAAASAYAAWCRFRREFTGMAETLEELREDLLWIKEWQPGKKRE